MNGNEPYDFYPATCLNCEYFDVLNYNEKGQKCKKCGESMTFYDDMRLYQAIPRFDEDALKEGKIVPVYEGFNIDKTTMLSLQYYRCPRCCEYNLRFEQTGLWD